MNIWQRLTTPIYILAPMEDVTDTVFRQMVISCGRPHLFFTEFTNVEGMASLAGDPIVSQRLQYLPEEKPLIAQVWGKTPELYYQAALRIKQQGFDGIDINMGCPQKSIVRQGACASLIKNKHLASEIIHATKQGAGELPVSVKTRIGYETIKTEEWIGFLLDHSLDALTVHGRTAREMSAVPAHWDEIRKVVQLRDARNLSTKIIGNGDVSSITEAVEKVSTYGVDGVMIGRGIFHNPYLFNESIQWDTMTIGKRLALLETHVRLFQETWGSKKNFATLKKFTKIYISGFDNASEMREQLMATNSYNEMVSCISEFQALYDEPTVTHS